MKKPAYTTAGSIRGCCGHTHRTLSGALRCLQRDEDGCGSQGGYSDRRIVRLPDYAELSDDERQSIDALLD